MRATVTLDPELLIWVMPDVPRSAVLNEALRALIERETVLRFARLGGTDVGASGGLAPTHRACHWALTAWTKRAYDKTILVPFWVNTLWRQRSR